MNSPIVIPVEYARFLSRISMFLIWWECAMFNTLDSKRLSLGTLFSFKQIFNACLAIHILEMISSMKIFKSPYNDLWIRGFNVFAWNK